MFDILRDAFSEPLGAIDLVVLSPHNLLPVRDVDRGNDEKDALVAHISLALFFTHVAPEAEDNIRKQQHGKIHIMVMYEWLVSSLFISG